jgi:drug/metabolite transporter superfamily protein YnfA
MGSRFDRYHFTLATIMLAALACLQAGIDPVFLTLISSAHPVRPADHGWIVGATQTGMAIGSLIAWRLGGRLPQLLFPVLAIIATLASIATVWTDETQALLAVRGGYGLAMGVIYTHAMSLAAAGRPNGAYGGVFLVQLIISTVVALILPAISREHGAQTALAALCLAPFIAMILTALTSEIGGRRVIKPTSEAYVDGRAPIEPPAWALAAATLLFVCATMMVWSFTGAMAIAADIREEVVGQAVAIGSLAGACTAACVMRERPIVPLPLTGVFAGLGLLAPIAATRSGDPNLFILSVILLNIGSTAIIIRGSGMATARSQDPVFRRLVTCTHSVGMIIGPVIGSIATATAAEDGLLIAAVASIGSGCIALLLASLWSLPEVDEIADYPHHAEGVFAIIL